MNRTWSNMRSARRLMVRYICVNSLQKVTNIARVMWAGGRLGGRLGGQEQKQQNRSLPKHDSFTCPFLSCHCDVRNMSVVIT